METISTSPLYHSSAGSQPQVQGHCHQVWYVCLAGEGQEGEVIQQDF